MDLKLKLTVTLPEELTETLGITENTLFGTSYEDGHIIIESYNEDEFVSPDEEYDEDEKYCSCCKCKYCTKHNKNKN